jgi:ribulose-5-phosphate 4-epimerase/fuculose-1-phosphate aldolase
MSSAVSFMPVPSLKGRVSSEEWDARVNLAAAYRLVARHGWTDLTATHISLRVESEGGKERFLINPFGMLFSQVTASSLVKIDVDGDKVGPSPYPVNPAGFVIHSAIHMAREDAHCVMHTHTVAGMGVSMQEDGLLMASQHAANFFGNLAYHDIEHMEAGIDGRQILARDLGSHKAMIMRNHGLLTCGATVGEAFFVMHMLEKACAAQIAAQAGGAKIRTMSPETCEFFAGFMRERSQHHGDRAWPALIKSLDDDDPGYRD